MNLSKLTHCLSAAAVLLPACQILAQTQPALSCQLYAGIDLNGATGSVYSIQATSDLADSDSWKSLALVRLTSTNFIWTDKSKTAANGQRFFRAVLTATNLVWIQPGTFTMGSPTNEASRGTGEIQHLVTISKGFYVGKFLVTQGDYLRMVGNNPSTLTGDANLPVDSLDWIDASNYCALRTAQERATGLIPTNWVYRLPTESEWEYACRAGTTTAFCWPLGNALHSGQANFAGTNEYDSVNGTIINPSGINLQKITVVGSYAPNNWGLYDMAGNVFEWCQDWSGAYPSGSVVDPQGPDTGIARVMRGGSWGFGAVGCRSACRTSAKHSNGAIDAGCRVVLAEVQ